MNYIDITENKKTHSIKNRVINIINREGIQGPPGRDGISPTINPDNGHWMLGDVDTGYEAIGQKGEPGSTPYIQDGWWCLDGERLILARGADGSSPRINEADGHWYINGEDTGYSALGLKGDSPRIVQSDVDGKFYWYIGDENTEFEVCNIKQEDIPQLLVFSSWCVFPEQGSLKNLYVDATDNSLYRWTGTGYRKFENKYHYIDCGKAQDYAVIY